MTNGIHHVTAIAGPARRNLDFYTRVLGLRLVKKTVNFDDPGTYHLYYGDMTGSPGTILTFFPWEHVAPGQLGTGETVETAFRVPRGALGYWAHRFVSEGVPHENPARLFGDAVLSFQDRTACASPWWRRMLRQRRSRHGPARRCRPSTPSEASIR
jgi:glyoxalase family protein